MVHLISCEVMKHGKAVSLFSQCRQDVGPVAPGFVGSSAVTCCDKWIILEICGSCLFHSHVLHTAFVSVSQVSTLQLADPLTISIAADPSASSYSTTIYIVDNQITKDPNHRPRNPGYLYKTHIYI